MSSCCESEKNYSNLYIPLFGDGVRAMWCPRNLETREALTGLTRCVVPLRVSAFALEPLPHRLHCCAVGSKRAVVRTGMILVRGPSPRAVLPGPCPCGDPWISKTCPNPMVLEGSHWWSMPGASCNPHWPSLGEVRPCRSFSTASINKMNPWPRSR